MTVIRAMVVKGGGLTSSRFCANFDFNSPNLFLNVIRTQITERHRAQAVSFFLGTGGGGHKTYAYDIETPTPRCPAKSTRCSTRSSAYFRSFLPWRLSILNV